MTKTAVANGDEPGDLMSTADAAHLLGITPRRLFQLIDQGDIGAYRFGRVIRLRGADVLLARAILDPPEPEWP